MGRLLYETGKMDERKRIANERGSAKEGKASFSWAWEMDGTEEERQKGVTKDIAQRTMITQSRHITILDAPGHKDFIPNMISGAAQADAALLVVDSSVGSFESGFDRGGQTQEHMQLVRSLGVTQIVVAVNKLDMVEWSQQRYDEICTKLSQFLQQTGFQASRTKFVPVCAMGGINLVNGSGDDVKALTQWYSGLSLIDCLNELEPPQRQIDAPLRIPLVNVFRGQTSLSHGVGVSGRICSGVVQVGDRLRVVPGDEVAAVRLIDYEDESVPWAAAGSNATFYLAGIDPIHLSVGSVLCSLNEPVRMSSSFEAKIMLFDLQKPVLGGTSVELFCHAREAPATITKLVATLDRSTGAVTRNNPRVLQRNSVAIVQISLRTASLSGSVSSSASLPLEISDANKDMSRILLRSEGETIGAGENTSSQLDQVAYQVLIDRVQE
ncbi:P-loop containing nucleoside triphosphate hydrolase protein [Auriculariales sp. MPI-PUGE-AT-0066]|nr:P-loop containing nucleoside triphosphate hydrolase protein [Auriculariales sp. MPI-PUGE-AT-0066]